MKYEFDKEKFLKRCHFIPSRVKSGEDLLKFCFHIQYRIAELEEKSYYHSWATKQDDMSEDEKITEEIRIKCLLSDAWKNVNHADYISFEEICKRGTRELV